jgi:hypothetical protein
VTAEIAILNKTAVALATDSAVTISAGSEDQKIYDSADKLFDLCGPTPIGVMIYNGMQFMQAPLPMLLMDYRNQQKEFERLPEAAFSLLRFLTRWGIQSPPPILHQSMAMIVESVADEIKARVQSKIDEVLSGANAPEDPMGALATFFEEAVSLFSRVLSKAPDATFIDADGKIGAPTIGAAELAVIRGEMARHFMGEEDPMLTRLAEIGKNAILKIRMTAGFTGLVVAGFGSRDIFPSLCSFEIDGIVFGKLKFRKTNEVDIDRIGDRARVIPFAQKEMVERFLYGLDGNIERSISQFCKLTIPTISEQILAHLEMSDEDRAGLARKAREAEEAFLSELQTERFDDIRSQSRSDIEGMVEFMPKPELATMAEALVNLTSMKRKVSRGMETVGGPVDVAVISRSDGFIWVKRKHYFPAEANPRYLQRVKAMPESHWENRHAARPKSSKTKSGARRSS